MAKENGLLDYMESEINKRNRFIGSCLLKQETLRNSFVDEDARKNYEIKKHVNKNYDVDVFNHESDKYQAKQKINKDLTNLINAQQRE